MDIKKLLSGVAIIIDDNIKKEHSGDPILKIRDQLKNNNHISILEYEDLPDDSEIPNFKNISFVLLDWYLFETPEPGMLMDELLFINNNIEFLKKIKKVSFTPVFIFSNQSPDSIIRKLSEEDLYNEDSNNYIFIKRKQDLLSEDNDNLLLTEIENWLKETPSMYVLKEWEHSLNEAKRKLFWDFYEINPNWPSVLQKTFTDDGSDVNYELGNFIYKNLSARGKKIFFDDDILNQGYDNIRGREDIRKVLEAERFINNSFLPPDYPCTGDLFENLNSTNGYYLNIRPECDIAIRPGRTSKPELYCLKCREIKEDKIRSEKLFKEGTLLEKINNSYIPFIDNGKILEVLFDDLKIFNWMEKLKNNSGGEIGKIFKETRIGRVLPPYITKVQQRYSSYLQRQGLPAIPKEAM
ncbi:MAG TPA: hypothetical protein VFD10_08630 [Atribacterota bacterium]|nr:hypothetical protein [Atribacterota bacterium]